MPRSGFYYCPACDGTGMGVFELRCMTCKGKGEIGLTAIRQFRDNALRMDFHASFDEARNSLVKKVEKALAE